jgi:hypothetical protein
MNKFIKFFALAVVAIGLSSCLKDKNIDDLKYGTVVNESKIIEIPLAAKGFALVYQNVPESIDLVGVALAAAEVASEDIIVTLSLDKSAALISGYNTDKGTSLVALPTSLYTLPGGLTVTIPKGSKEGILKLNMNPINLDPSTTYGLGLRIESVSKAGYIVSGNFATTVVRVAAKNKYDGVYAVKAGNVQRYSSPGVPTVDALNGSMAGNTDVTLTTVGGNTVLITGLKWGSGYNSGIAGIDNLQAEVDPATNLVTMKALGNATLKNMPGKVNKYDPATKTFTLNFDWNQTSTAREITGLTLVYKKAR